MPPSLSVLIIARDESRDLPGCLNSLQRVASETVVLVDAATADDTGKIAQQAGCKVSFRRFDDYTRQRQAALDLCTRDWVLWIDADETLSPELREEILTKITAAPATAAAFSIPFSVRFMGQRLRFGGLGSERHVRLFRRGQARFIGGAVHEGLQIDGSIGELSEKIIHQPYRDLSEYLLKLDRYTTLAAQKKFSAGQRFRWAHHAVLPWELFKRLVLRLGLLDGRAGTTYATLSAFHHWLKYVKLREMEAAQ